MNLIVPMRETARSEREHMVLYGVDWTTYEKLIDAFSEYHVRMTYDGGTLELMSPQPIHEQVKHWFNLLFAMLGLELSEWIGASAAAATSMTPPWLVTISSRPAKPSSASRVASSATSATWPISRPTSLAAGGSYAGGAAAPLSATLAV